MAKNRERLPCPFVAYRTATPERETLVDAILTAMRRLHGADFMFCPVLFDADRAGDRDASQRQLTQRPRYGLHEIEVRYLVNRN